MYYVHLGTPKCTKMDEQQVGIRRQKAYRTRKDILNLYDDAELTKRYRLDREGIMLVTDMVRDAQNEQ